jgi:hypothetical protein
MDAAESVQGGSPRVLARGRAVLPGGRQCCGLLRAEVFQEKEERAHGDKGAH